MTWHATLSLDYTLESERSVLRHVHEGPLRVLKSLYPQGEGTCHNVLVHPPGGLVGGDTLDIQVALGSGAQALITTAGARLEWLPHAELPFVCGRFCQHIELPGVWLERGFIFFVTGSALERPRRERALDSARQVLHAHALQSVAGVTCPNPRVVVLRVLAPQVEMAMNLLKKIWAVWRQVLWDQTAVPPRIWTM
ncbi:urease accessory protein UreD [Rhodoferax sp.]|uniref:urease accessory protein UreD n=1 Tax=Rhodoferax sp. TaxID=50421 RepID=UPI00374CB917